jgi:hypothetical protein
MTSPFRILADAVLAQSEWKPVSGQRYCVQLELSGDTYRAQVLGGPTFAARHSRLGIPKTWLTFGCWNDGTVTLRDLHLWKGQPQS